MICRRSVSVIESTGGLAATVALRQNPEVLERGRKMKIAAMIARILLGLVFVVFGSNAFLHFIPAVFPSGLAGQYLSVLFQSHYVLFIGRQHPVVSPAFGSYGWERRDHRGDLLGDRVLPLPAELCGTVCAEGFVRRTRKMGYQSSGIKR